MTTGYYRFPTIYKDTIIYVSEDDLWSVPTMGGITRRLTSNLGEVRYPRLSPDGQWLAFVGREEGTSEIYLMPSAGGSARRMTYLSSDCAVVGWTSDGKHILFSSSYGQIMPREHGLYTISIDSLNGDAEPLPYGPARAITFSADGRTVLGRNVQDSARWKRYRGGTAGHLWLDNSGNGEFQRFLEMLEGNVNAPMWIENGSNSRIFFASDHEGVSNLYSCTPDGDDLQRHTDHEDYYVRNPTTDGKQIVYHAGADIYVYDIANDSSRRVEIDYLSPRVQRNRKFAYAGSYVQNARLHPSGLALSLTARGKAFGLHNHEGPVVQYGTRDGVRYRLPEWFNDGRRLLLISDESGEETLEIHTSDPDKAVEVLADLDIGRVLTLKMSPMEDRVALTNHRQELLIVDLEEKTVTLVEQSKHERIEGFNWSPDGRWLAYGCSLTSKTSAIRLYRLADPDAEDEALHESITYTITEPVLHDMEPAFDPDGKYLYFLSYRDFNPIYDNMNFALSFPWGMRPFLITLQTALPNPFIPRPDWGDEEGEKDEEGDEDEAEEVEGEDAVEDEDDGGSEEDEDLDDGELDDDEIDTEDEVEDELEDESAIYGIKCTVVTDPTEENETPEASQDSSGAAEEESGEKNGEESGEKSDEKVEDKPEPRNKSQRMKIDIEGIQQRVLPFPVQDGLYRQIAGISGKVYFTTFALHGQLDGNYESEGDEHPDRGVLRVYNFKEYKTDNVVDGVSRFELSRNNKKILYSSSHRLRVIPATDKPPANSGPARRTGWVDLSRVKISVDPQQEWDQMLREAWRLQRDQFWTEDMSQIDWQEVYQRYAPLVERVSTRSEFSDLMWEMQGELGTSHAYEMGGDYRHNPHYYNQGLLGASFHWDAEAGGYRIDDMLLGDVWDEKTHSPLAAPGIDVKIGDVIIAVNGQRVSEEVSPAQLLVSLAGHEVLLTFAPRPPEDTEDTEDTGDTEGIENTEDAEDIEAVNEEMAGEMAGDVTGEDGANDESTEVVESQSVESQSVEEPSANESEGETESNGEESKPDNRPIVIQTMRSEVPSRYRAWVQKNRQLVHKATEGRIGYLHIPDMGARGYAEFHRGYLAEVDRDGLIVDVRYNGGGHVSQLLLEKLARRRLGYDLSRWGGSEPYPADSVAGPIVALTNEHAGSDGDIFCHGFKMLKLGPLIGKRTWGGVIGIFPRHSLVDGTTTTQPVFSFWFEDVGWGVENYGTEPDIEIDMAPQDYAQGADPQLDRSIAEALRMLEENPVVKPDLSSRPNLALPKLPPRK